MAPRTQEFPGRPDFSHVLCPERGRRGSPQGEGDTGRARDHATLSKASQPPLPALTYLLHLVVVELREEVGKQMRGDHFATARRRGNQGWSACGEGRPSGQAAFYPGLATQPGAGSPSDPKRSLAAVARPAGGSRVSRNRFWESQLLEDSQKSLPATWVARLSSANFGHRITKAQLGNNRNPTPLV